MCVNTEALGKDRGGQRSVCFSLVNNSCIQIFLNEEGQVTAAC